MMQIAKQHLEEMGEDGDCKAKGERLQDLHHHAKGKTSFTSTRMPKKNPNSHRTMETWRDQRSAKEKLYNHPKATKRGWRKDSATPMFPITTTSSKLVMLSIKSSRSTSKLRWHPSRHSTNQRSYTSACLDAMYLTHPRRHKFRGTYPYYLLVVSKCCNYFIGQNWVCCNKP